ncbi:MAG: ElyC/SanA/YdcF family protein [Candidatus Binatia bacterium]|nr:ElyC/SanA/YdcF family protein [Candidatus Binatia bacterium]
MNPGPPEREHPSIIGGDSEVRKRGPQRILWLIACVLAVGLVCLVPQFLAISGEIPSSAQAIYVFPGQVPERAECGAALYRQGVAPKVVFSGGRVDTELAAIGHPIDDATLNARIAHDHGVPDEAEVLLHAGSSTWEDALALGAWMRSADVREVIAVTSPTHSRRAQLTLWLSLGDLGDGIRVYRCGTIYGPLWWTRERSIVRVTLEALKFGFYAIRYFVPALLGFDPVPPRPQRHA